MSCLREEMLHYMDTTRMRGRERGWVSGASNFELLWAAEEHSSNAVIPMLLDWATFNEGSAKYAGERGFGQAQPTESLSTLGAGVIVSQSQVGSRYSFVAAESISKSQILCSIPAMVRQLIYHPVSMLNEPPSHDHIASASSTESREKVLRA